MSEHYSVNHPLLNSTEIEVAGVDGQRAEDDIMDNHEEARTQKNELGILLGVYIPCMLSIIGAILFLRLGWSVGQAGVIGAVLTYSLATLTVVLTTLSIAAISTNGSVGGGGAYYMISRTLGPEFGGAVGVVFYAANTVGVTFYLVAFGEEMVSLTGDFTGVNGKWTQTIISSLCLFGCFLVALTGAKYFSKFNAVVFTVEMLAIVIGLFSFLCRKSGAMEGYTGLSLETLKDNIWVDYQPSNGKQMDFFKVFTVVFPAMTGVMAGANLSGDLKDPGRSIGRGTLWAIFTSFSTYIALIFAIGASVKRETLINNLNVMQDIAPEKMLVAVGILVSTISSGLGNLVSSGRILQALARDNLFPVLRPFKYGTKAGDEPIPGIVVSYLIAQGCIFMGSLDSVAMLISQFFLLVYLFTNVACFILRVAGAPNFRPQFRYFSWHTALAGAICCGVILFVSGPLTASVSVAILILIWMYITYWSPAAGWGDVAQALIFHQVRKYLLKLDERKAHAKFWRPSIILLIQDPSSRHALTLLDFCNNVKKGGLYVVGNVMIGDITKVARTLPLLRRLWLELVSKFDIKAFIETGIGPDARVAYQNLITTAGLGGMKANTVCMPFFTMNQLTNSLSNEGIVTPDGGFVDPSVLASKSQEDSESTRPPSLYMKNGQIRVGSAVEYTLRFNSLSTLGPQFPPGTDHERQSCYENSENPPTLATSVSTGDLRERFRQLGGADVIASSTQKNSSRKVAKSKLQSRTHRVGETAASIAQLQTSWEQEISSDHAGDSLKQEPSNGAIKRENSDIAGSSPTGRASVLNRATFMNGDVSLPVSNVKEYMDIAKDALLLRRNLLITRGFQSLDKDLIVSFRNAAHRAALRSEAKSMRIDVWLPCGVDLGSSGSASLALQLAHILHNTDIWSSNTALRVVSIVEFPEEADEELKRVKEMLNTFRFMADVRVVSIFGLRERPTLQLLKTHNSTATSNDKVDIVHSPAVINELIRHNTENTCLLFLPFPILETFKSPEEDESTLHGTVPVYLGQGAEFEVSTDVAYAYDLETLTRGLPPCVLAASANVDELVTTQL